MDDRVIETANDETIKRLKTYLMKKFLMTDLSDIKLFLGTKVEKNKEKLILDHRAYIKTTLDKFNMGN